MAHMYISNPLNGRGPDNFFSTHPSTANRVEALRRLAGEMGVTASRAPDMAPRRTAGPWGWSAPAILRERRRIPAGRG